MSDLAQLESCHRKMREAFFNLSDASDEAPPKYAGPLRKLAEGAQLLSDTMGLDLRSRQELAESRLLQEIAGNLMEVAERPDRFEMF
jgi:hypothetical protein